MPVLESLIRDQQRRSPNLQWLPLTDAVTKTCLRRTTRSGSRQIRFFTDHFSIDNPSPETAHYTLFKDEPDPDFVETIAVNGAPVPFRKVDGHVVFELDLKRGDRVNVAIGVHTASRSAVAFGRSYPARVFVRRAMSEFRDEVLSRYPASWELAKRWIRFWRKVAKGSSAKGGA
jgi:hypothetical protein